MSKQTKEACDLVVRAHARGAKPEWTEPVDKGPHTATCGDEWLRRGYDSIHNYSTAPRVTTRGVRGGYRSIGVEV